MEALATTSKRTPPGTILEIKLQPEMYAYAIVLDKIEVTFYRHIESKISNDFFRKSSNPEKLLR
jgi:hypothetical protein